MLCLSLSCMFVFFFFFQAEDGIRDLTVTGVQTCDLPISWPDCSSANQPAAARATPAGKGRPSAWGAWILLPGSGAALDRRSEEHTSELQSQSNLVCRLLLEKKKKPTQSPRELPDSKQTR